MGWITGLELDGKDVRATVEWTKPGARAIRDKTYTRISPTFVNSYKTERGEDRGRALIGAATTNRPVLKDLPVLSLSEPIAGTVQLANHPRSSRARRGRARRAR
jgi:phage I-like protein